MLEVIGAILPNAVAIAVSPMPIIAVILVLMSPRAVPLGLSFLVGWLVGIVVAVTTFTALGDLVPEPTDNGDGQPVLGTIQLFLGLALLLLAARSWRNRPREGDAEELPRWMSSIDTMGALPTSGLAFVLAALNPKNLLVAGAAGTLIGRSTGTVADAVLAIAVFTLVAALTVAVPVLVRVFAPQSAERALTSIRQWLTVHNAAIMTVLLVVVGAKVIGTGLGAF